MFSPKGWVGCFFFHETAIWRDLKGAAKEDKKLCKIVWNPLEKSLLHKS